MSQIAASGCRLPRKDDCVAVIGYSLDESPPEAVVTHGDAKMRALLISANMEQINMPVLPFGPACVVSAAQQAGHDVTLVDLMFESDVNAVLGEAIAALRPECIGISVRNIDDQNSEAPQFLLRDIRDVIASCRTLSDAPVVVGGAGYSIFPESALDYLEADMGIAGEGEAAFPMLLSYLECAKDVAEIPGLHIRGGRVCKPRAHIQQLDAFELPKPELLAVSANKNPDPWMPVQTRRGCPFHCTYCTTPTIEGAHLRKRRPEQVVAWLGDWVAAGYRNFFFVDNTFNFPPSYAKELCRLMIANKLDIQWQGIIYPQKVDAELVQLMAEAGCVHVSLGFESGCERMLRNLDKHFTPEEVRVIAARLGDCGIERMGFLLLGAPGETRESVEESLAFADSLSLEMLSVTPGVRICPDTPLAVTAAANGAVSRQDNLLYPRFYLEDNVAEWLPTYLKQWAAERPYVLL